MAHHHRVAGRAPLLGGDAKACQIGHQPIRRILALLLVGRIGRDGGDTQQTRQPVEGGRQLIVDAVENVGKGHDGPLDWRFGFAQEGIRPVGTVQRACPRA